MKKDNQLSKHHDILQLLLLVGLGLIILSRLASGNFFWIPFLAGLVLSAAAIIYRNKYYICPHCRKKLNPLLKLPAFCPHCGERLE